MYYNVRVKTYPDGHKQYFWSENPIFRLDEDVDSPELIKSVKRKRHRAKLFRQIRSFDRVEDNEGIKEVEDESFLRRQWNVSRAVQIVYDIARSNSFHWFVTLTLNEVYVDRYDYCACADVLKLFTDRLRKMKCKWIIVPEQHEDGAYHFHGLVAGDLPLTPSGKKWYNEVEQKLVPVYNVGNYEFGWTTATEILSPHKVSSYVAKYLTKQIAVPKGKKCYWASRSLARPSVEYFQTEHEEDIYDPDSGETCIVTIRDPDWSFGAPPGVRYVKEIKNEYGRFVISEE